MPKYLFKRPDSQNWCIRFRYPDSVIEKSLGTPDLKQAEILALPLIAQHKAALLALKPRIDATWRREYEPGLHDALNGERVAATEAELRFYSPNGKLLRTAPNGGPAFQIVNLQHRIGISYVDDRMVPIIEEEAKKGSTVKTDDDPILETYLKHANITGYAEREAREVWALFKRLTNNKLLKNCDRDDGRLLVQFYDTQGLKTKTITKKIAWLNAAVNLAIKELRHKTINPFSSIVPKRKDSLRRMPLSEADMKAIKRNLSRLDKNDQLLIRLLASTGMRLSEAFEINTEANERGVRYCLVGHKTEQSLRRVPFPAAVLTYLPRKIAGPLFKRDAADPADAASKRLNRFLRDCGISDPAKVIHSFRHRAQDRLRAAECPQDIRWAVLGHEEKTVAEGYGAGFPVTLLRKWIDKIGF
jgi:integrase